MESATEFRTISYEAITVGETFMSDDFLIKPEDVETFAYAVDDHQTVNAHFLVGHDAAWLLRQEKLDSHELAVWLSSLTRAELLLHAERARAQAKPDATARMVAIVKEVAK